MNRFFLLLITIVLCIQTSCKHDKADSLSFRSVSFTGCNQVKSGSAASKSNDCIKYQLIDNKYLKIFRSNVSFNCATDSLILNINQTSNFISITETGHFLRAANCDCLHDFEYTIGPLNQKSYTILINEEHGGKMTYFIDFTKGTEWEYCETRIGYPW